MDSHIGQPLVSVIMPAFNSEQYIQEAIDSVRSQTYLNWELFIVDDGSTDNTCAIIKRNCSLDKRIHYIYQLNSKQGRSRNNAIANSSGELLAFLDSDDLWLPDKLEIQVQLILQKNVDLVFSNSFIIFNCNINNSLNKFNIKKRYYCCKQDIDLFIESNQIPILTVLVKKSKIQAAGCFAESNVLQYGEDYHLWLKLLLCGSVFYSTDSVLAKYRIHDNSVSSLEYSQNDKILDMLKDLKNFRPEFSNRFEKKIRHLHIDLYKKCNLNKAELTILIKKNIYYISKIQFSCFYLFLNWIFPPKVTKKFLIYILNGYIFSKWR
jgi:teichuronic acid biosynthesis glycosyltransferase TuaG